MMSAEVRTPYSVAEVSALTGLSARSVTRLFENERGVIIYEVPNPNRKRAGYRTIRIPRHVYERVMRRHTVV
jgi:AraC-like DNA-binding protein